MSSETETPRLSTMIGLCPDGTASVFLFTEGRPVKNGGWQTGPYTLAEIRAFAKELEDTVVHAEAAAARV